MDTPSTVPAAAKPLWQSWKFQSTPRISGVLKRPPESGLKRESWSQEHLKSDLGPASTVRETPVPISVLLRSGDPLCKPDIRQYPPLADISVNTLLPTIEIERVERHSNINKPLGFSDV